MIDRKAIQDRCDATSEGPWQVNQVIDITDDDCIETVVEVLDPQGDPTKIAGLTLPEEYKQAMLGDFNFIAHARTDIPDLLAEVERYQAALESITEIVSCGEDCGTYECNCSDTMQQIATQALKETQDE